MTHYTTITLASADTITFRLGGKGSQQPWLIAAISPSVELHLGISDPEAVRAADALLARLTEAVTALKEEPTV